MVLFFCSAKSQVKYQDRNSDHQIVKTLTTTDSVTTNIDSLVTTANEAGIVTVSVIGYKPTTSAAVTGVKTFRYKVVNGTPTLGTITDVSAIVTDSDISTSTFAINVVGTKVYIQVKGKLSNTIY
jgi:hypothetical protein